MAYQSGVSMAILLAGGLALSGCAEGVRMPEFLRGGDAAAPEGGAVAPQTSVRIVERDVEAPEVFQIDETGLWDGRPSLGGVWVAHPDVTDPERVIIRNPANGRFVIGALFRRERENLGPRLQVSSDAASALGLLAGAPGTLNVTALRREETPEDTVAPAAPEAPAEVAETPLPDPTPAPAADDAAALAAAAAAAIGAAPAPAPAPAAPPAAAPSRPFIQIGIFSQEANANRAAAQMREAGLTANVLQEASQGQTFWRVTVGPAATAADRDRALARVRALGFADAYAVSR